jgi:hypothetical protein
MIHYTCDCCKRPLGPDELRYVVKMEVCAAFDPGAAEELSDDRDHLQEIQQILERCDDTSEPQVGTDIYEQLRFDLCTECRAKFVKHPLGREQLTQFDFSQN